MVLIVSVCMQQQQQQRLWHRFRLRWQQQWEQQQLRFTKITSVSMKSGVLPTSCYAAAAPFVTKS